MVTRVEQRSAGLTALATAGLLAGALALFRTGPASDHGGAVLNWHAANAVNVRISAVLWLLAMIGLVGFAVGFREALWATAIDRSWVVTLLVQGAAVFATVVVVATAVGWALTDLAVAGHVSGELAGSIWAVERALLRFASWGLTVPVLLVGIALYRHSVLGQIGAVGGVFVVAALLIPLTWGVGLYVFAGWLAFAGLTLLKRVRSNVAHHPEHAPARPEHRPS